MNVRSITLFCHPGWPPQAETLARAGRFIATARLLFEGLDYQVQTTRLATVPFACFGVPLTESAPALERAAADHGFDYVALGPALPDRLADYAAIPAMLAATHNAFVGGVLADANGIHPAAVRACAEVIHAAAPLEPNGFANLRFAALADVPPGAPFFPAAYAPPDFAVGEMRFALALEAADLAVEAFTDAPSVAAAQARLVQAIENHAARLCAAADDLSRRLGVPFGGLDFSLAPFPEAARSLGTALERLGVPRVGLHGSLAAAAILAEAIDRADFPRTGFSGLMLPVLEDATLALRAAEGVLGVKDMLLYSAVCGTGLDTLPLPGDTPVEALQAVLLDLAALARRLRKPLTARLMPMPGRQAGDPITFDFPYFAGSRVLALEAAPLRPPLAGTEGFDLQPRPR